MKLQAKTSLPTPWGKVQIHAYAESENERMPIVALVFGPLSKTSNVRLHSECFTGDLLESYKCDCGEQLRTSLDYLKKNGGVLLYLRQEGRNIGLINKLKAYRLQEDGANTIEANHQLGFGSDLRNYDAAAKVLTQLGIKEVHLLTNNPNKKEGLESANIKVVSRVPIVIKARPENKGYLDTKRDLMGHLLDD